MARSGAEQFRIWKTNNPEAERERQHRYYLRHRLEKLRKNRAYLNSDEGRKYLSEEYDRNRIKHSARRKVMYAVRTGKLQRKPCEICGSKSVQAHHPDYSKPLDVRWLCQKHHTQEHSKKGNTK